MTFGLELHAWKGASLETDLFYRYVRLGFVTLGFSKESLADQLKRIERLLDSQPHGDVVNIPHEGMVR